MTPSTKTSNALAINDLSWQDGAACKSQPSSLFFADGDGVQGCYDAALAVCGACGVRQECGAFALANKIEYGVWGGMTPRQRGVRAKTTYQTLECECCGVSFHWPPTRGYRPPKFCGNACQRRALSSETVHGRVGTYKHGCRCDECREAGRVWRGERSA
jgi:WhiB family redox-sensing transcriptional regulator